MNKKCPMCHAALPDIDKDLNDLNTKIKELEHAIEEAKKAETKEEADNIFDGLL
jgi:uncharacterized coiled-coil DUF342 family protein